MYMMQHVDIDSLDLRHIRLLARLIETRNLSRAARQIGLSPSAASHALARLRRIVGDPIFISSHSGLTPTPFGERLASSAGRALTVLSAGLAGEPHFDPRTSTRRFCVYLRSIGQVVFLPELMAHVKKEAPGVSVRVARVAEESLGHLMASGEIDLAVGIYNDLQSGFHQIPLGQERYVCIVRAGHPRFRCGMTREAFLATPHATADSGGAHAAVDRILEQNGIQRSVRLIVPDFVVIPMLIAESDMMAIVPRRLAVKFVSYLQVRILPLPIPMPGFAVSAYWHERYHRDPGNKWFRQVFVKLFRKQWAEMQEIDEA